jgi:site-specific recombinase XerD
MSVAALLPSWQLVLESDNKSPKTIKSYTASLKSLAKFLREHDMPDDIEDVEPEHIRAFLVSERERTSAAFSQQHYRNLHVYFRWIESEGERRSPNPMARVGKPAVPESVKPFFTEVELSKLLTACKGQDFEARRDTAIVRILLDTGVRVSGLANLRFDAEDDDRTDVFLQLRRLRVVLNGGRQHWVPIGKKAASDLDRYLRVRARHPRASSSPWLWLGVRNGPRGEHFTDTGVRQMLERRGEQAGVQNVHPHRFRHTFADSWLANGGNIDDLMNVAGWQSITMPLQYAKGRGIARAAAAHGRLSPGDRI